MKPFDYFKKCLTSHYANFEGRARRSEYWYFVLFYLIIFMVFYSILFASIFLESSGLMMILSALIGIFALGIIIPSIAVSVRRLHDIGKSGWMLLIGLIPLIGGILILVWHCTDSQPGKNEYGPNPKSGDLGELHDHLV